MGIWQLFQLNRPACFLLHHNCACSELTAADDVADLHPDKVAATQVAINREVKQRTITQSAAFIEIKSDLPYLLWLERALGAQPRLLAGDLRAWLLERTKSDFTLRGLVAELAEEDVKVDCVQVWRIADAEGQSFKKSILPVEQLRPNVARRRAQWKKFQNRPDPRSFVFVDET